MLRSNMLEKHITKKSPNLNKEIPSQEGFSVKARGLFGRLENECSVSKTFRTLLLYHA